MMIGATSADYRSGRDAGMADGSVASFLAGSLALRGEHVTLPWRNEQRKNFDSARPDDWKRGYEDGFKETAPKLEIYLKKLGPDTPDEPFHPPPNTPTGIAESLAPAGKLGTVAKWGLGIALVTGAAYAGGRWYRSRTHP